MDHQAILQQSLAYIEDNLQTEIAAAELAEQAGFSLFHYYRLFHQATGLPVMQYILRRRLLHGIYAISQGQSKTTVALRYGFDTYAGFYKAFCREFHDTPSAFLASGRAKRPYRIDITKEDHMTITHKRASHILQNWNVGNQSIADIYYEGTESKNDHAYAVGEQYILKYTANQGKLKKHIEVSKALQSIGLLSALPVPTVNGEEYISDGDVYFYLTRRIPGEALDSHRFADGDGRFVGEIIGQLHLALSKIEGSFHEADLLISVKDWALPKAKTVLKLSDEFCKKYLRIFSALYPTLPRQLIHRDPNPGNIIFNDAHWGFIDFELAEQNARIYDPCYAATAVLSETFGVDNDKWIAVYRDIICGYDSVVGLTDTEWKAIPYMVLANQFVCVAWFAEQDKYTELFETNLQMTKWLISGFDELSRW